MLVKLVLVLVLVRIVRNQTILRKEIYIYGRIEIYIPYISQSQFFYMPASSLFFLGVKRDSERPILARKALHDLTSGTLVIFWMFNF